MSVNTSCLYQYDKWNYKNAATGTSDAPCTNVPIFCELCPVTNTGERRAIWRYNTITHAMLHHEQEHPSIPNLFILPQLPGSMLVKSHISKEEERALGIGEAATISYQDDFDLPMSEDPIMVAHITQKRGRKPTVSKVEPETKRKKD